MEVGDFVVELQLAELRIIGRSVIEKDFVGGRIQESGVGECTYVPLSLPGVLEDRGL